MDTFDSSYEFIDLLRTFHELPEHSYDSDNVDISRAFHIGAHLHWSGLIQEYRLIILAEAGSGKTVEIRNIARTLREQGKSVFFLRLEHISRDFEDAFEVGTYEAFKEWLASNEEGWLFLDSVDEARLRHPRDFELAICKLSGRISTAKERTHIAITGRTTAWRPKTDLHCCTNHLPYTIAATTVCEPLIDKDDPDDPEGSLRTKADTRDKSKPIFKIVTLDDLTPAQTEVFVKARGIEDSKTFLDAVDRADAWSFTSRPQDLEELVEFWLDQGRIGSRLEIMRNSIERRLAERDQDRADARPLSAERARQGARLLAAATTLSQNSTIRVPDGVENSKGIAIRDVLPDWDDKEQAALLSRPIFDEAIYGTVRFHHRSVREYLAAEWFAELLKHETSRRMIEGLFFRSQYGLDVVVPTLRPILPWLAILDEKIRERVRKIAPEIIFEGGDPSQLPLKVRRNILYEVCKQMDEGTTDRSMQGYAAVQRFVNSDLSDDVRALLRQYSDNEDLTVFLLRMVWLGELKDALPESMSVALKPTVEQYARLAAFKAINAIGSNDDQEHVRQNFLAEASELKREWLAELLKGVHPTEQTLAWLLACLEKSEPQDPYTVDHLAESMMEFVSRVDIDLLPQLVSGLNRLLHLAPLVERRHCEISAKFRWLLAPASEAIEQLILARYSSSLEPDALDILHKISVVRDYGIDDLTKVKTEFSKFVAEWSELNRSLFWFEVQRSRETFDKKHGERLTDFWQVSSVFGSFWQFEEGDFEYVTEAISRQVLLDDKLVALSLAFNLYKAAKRPRAWLMQLKKLVAGNNALSDRLKSYLNPPPQGRNSHRWKQQEAGWKKRDEANRKKREKYHVDWKNYLTDNLDKERALLYNPPGSITSSLLYLFDRLQEKKNLAGRWTDYNWKTLITEYGEEVARFYRDSTVSFWRHYEPKLRSEGAPPNETPYAVIIGLVGIEIEANETKDWTKTLNTAEVELVCRYASLELNGFPTWFPKLFETYPEIVCDFLFRQICYELSIDKPEGATHYVLNDVSCYGQWAWNALASSIYGILKAGEPENLTTLDTLLKILQESTIQNDLLEKLASEKCRTLKKLDHAACWFAVWTGVAPEAAIASLKKRIAKIADPEQQTKFAMIFVTYLLGVRMDNGSVARSVFNNPEYLKSLYLLMHEYIRSQEDVDRAGKGVYSPELRDNAQYARNSLFSLLNQAPGKESFLALMDIATLHPEQEYRQRVLLHAKKKAEQDSDIEPWSLSEVRDFYKRLERTPNNHRELAELAVLRLFNLRDDLEHGDSSIASILRNVERETDMRKYIGQALREKALGRYSIPQEEELADAKRPDLRFHGSGFDGPVPVELKLADKWSGPALFERLENQLCADYLRDNRSSRGIFLLVYQGREKVCWDVPDSNNRVDFVTLVAVLQGYWQQISPRFLNVDEITVIGIDLTKRLN